MFIEFWDRIEQRMDRLEQRMDKLEQRMDRLEQRMDAMHTEMLERFESVLDRLNDLEKRVGVIGANVEALQIQVFDLRGDVQRIEKRMTDVESSIYEVTTRVSGLGDDMRQRFRVVTDRLAAVEQRLAA